jgi:hypothetical protein
MVNLKGAIAPLFLEQIPRLFGKLTTPIDWLILDRDRTLSKIIDRSDCLQLWAIALSQISRSPLFARFNRMAIGAKYGNQNCHDFITNYYINYEFLFRFYHYLNAEK